jgi:hypothetical protein
MKKNSLYKLFVTALMLMVLAAMVNAASVPNLFVAGTVIDASKVNENFKYLADRSWELSGSNLYYNTGNVGIGTATPGAKIEVAGQIKITGGSPGAGKVLTSDATGLASWQTPSAVADGDWTISGTNMYSAVPGNIGIGTTSPGYKLHVAGSLNASSVCINGDCRTVWPSGSGSSLWSQSGNNIYYNPGNVGIGTVPGTDRLVVSQDDGSIHMGNVYIGCCGPNQIQPGQFRGLKISWDTDYAQIGLRDYGSDRKDIVINNEQGGDYIRFEIAGVDKTIIGGSYTLDVMGPAHASSFPTSSDSRLKKNVKKLSDVLEKLEKIRGVSFEWNELYKSLGRSTDRREIGVIAQEVEAVFPELVTTWGEENYRAVDYGRLTAVLIEAVKEQQKIINEQSSKIVAQQKVINEQGSRLADMEAKMVKFEAALQRFEILAAASMEYNGTGK